MNDKTNWHLNIPNNGVLCKTQPDELLALNSIAWYVIGYYRGNGDL